MPWSSVSPQTSSLPLEKYGIFEVLNVSASDTYPLESVFFINPGSGLQAGTHCIGKPTET